MTEIRSLQANDLYNVRFVSDARIAPDGSRVAFVLKTMDSEKNDYLSNIHVVDRQGHVTQFTAGNKDAAPRWSPDGRYLAFLSGRKEGAQIFLLHTDGGEAFPLTEIKHGAGVPFWSPDSRSIAFTGVLSTDPDENKLEDEKKKEDKPGEVAKTKVTDRTLYKADGAGYIGNLRRHIFTVDVADRTVTQLTDGDWNSDDPSWSLNGEQIVFAGNRSERWDVSLESDIYVMPRSGGEPRQVTQGGAYARPAFTSDGRLAFMGNSNPDDAFAPGRIYTAALNGSDLRDELGDWDGSLGNEVLSDMARSHDELGLYVEPRSDGLYFLGTVRGESNVYRATGGRVEPVTQGQQTISDFSIAADGSIACIRTDSTHAPDVFLCQNGRMEQLTHENDAFLDQVRIVQPERISYTGARGEQSEGWLIPPVGHESGKHPLLVYVHGGPQLAHGEALFLEYQYLAGQGYGVFFPNVHGSSSYGRAYQTSINGDWGNLDYQDVIAGAEEAASRSWVDRDRMGVLGGSYGGYMTNWVMTHSTLFRAGITERCLCNIVSFFGTSDSGWVWNRSFGAYPEQDVDKLWAMSPIKDVGNVQAPLMVMHSEGDDRTPLEQGEQMFNALRRLGKVTKFIVFPEESHGLSRIGKPSRRVERMTHILDWFNEHLA